MRSWEKHFNFNKSHGQSWIYSLDWVGRVCGLGFLGFFLVISICCMP